jgi:hypothetical protein
MRNPPVRALEPATDVRWDIDIVGPDKAVSPGE